MTAIGAPETPSRVGSRRSGGTRSRGTRSGAARYARWAGELLITFGVIVMLFAAYEVWGTTAIVEAHQQDLDKQLTQAWTTAGDEQAMPGSALARLYIPVLGMHWVVVEGVQLSQIQYAPGHYPGTAMPGQIGNFSVAGHRIPSIFWNLQEVTKGQPIIVQTKDYWYVYTVTEQEVVDPYAIRVVAPTPDDLNAAPSRAMLTLTTCNPKWADYQRLVVHAELTSTTPAAGGPPIPLGS